MPTSLDLTARPGGSTQLFVIVSDPVAQLQLPTIFNDIFRRAGFDAVLIPMHVAAEHFDRVFDGLKEVRNLAGVMVGVPHKQAVLRHAERSSEMAAIVGAANAMRRDPDGRWLAEMLDGDGFWFGLGAAGYQVRGRRALLVGAGSAGSAIAAVLLEQGLEHVCLSDIVPAKAAALAERFAARWPGRISTLATPDPRGMDMVINATPLGRRDDDPLPFDLERLTPGALVADIVVSSSETPLLREAAARGFRTHRGIYMLSEQVRSYAEFFGFAWALDRIGWSEDEYEA